MDVPATIAALTACFGALYSLRTLLEGFSCSSPATVVSPCRWLSGHPSIHDLRTLSRTRNMALSLPFKSSSVVAVRVTAFSGKSRHPNIYLHPPLALRPKISPSVVITQLSPRRMRKICLLYSLFVELISRCIIFDTTSLILSSVGRSLQVGVGLESG